MHSGGRAASRAAAWLALGLVLAGAADLQAQPRELRLLTFEGYADDEWVEAFEAAHDADVSVIYAETVDDMFARMSDSGGAGYDLVSIDTSLLGHYLEQDLIAPYDMAKIPGSANLLPAFRDVAELQRDGRTYGVPFAWGSIGLIYDPAEVRPPPTSWQVLWDESFAGRIIAFDDPDNHIATTAIALGYDDPFALSDDQLEAVKRKLIDQKKVLLGYFAGAEDGNAVWDSGAAVLMFSMGEFQAIDLARRGHDVAYAIPQEGGIGWLESWALSTGAQDVDLAHAWVDFVMRGEMGERMARAYGYGSTTFQTDGRDYAGRLTWLRPPENLAKRIEIWEEVKATSLE